MVGIKMNILPLVMDDWFKNIRLFFPETPGVVGGVFGGFVNDKNFFVRKEIVLHHAVQETHA